MLVRRDTAFLFPFLAFPLASTPYLPSPPLCLYRVVEGWAGRMSEAGQVDEGVEEHWLKHLNQSGHPLISSSELLPAGESELVLL